MHPLSVRRYIRQGKLKAIKAGGNIRIPQSSFEAFTQNISAPNFSLKKLPKAPKFVFTLDDPIFRLKARGVHLKQFE